MSDYYPGATVGRDDPRYDTLRRGFNLRWVGDPAEIALPGSAEQVRGAIQQAVGAGQRVTVRSGGHCYEDFAVGNVGGVIVDMAAMAQTYFDPVRGAFCVEAGATLWSVIWTLYKLYGRALPTGSCYSVGAGGHISGGGYGLLARKYGLIVDWLDAVEIVTVGGDGQARVTIAERNGEDADLLWACQGGGGGNFGIITRFWFRELPEAPTEAHLVNLAWDWDGMDYDEFAQIVGRYGRFLKQNSAPGGPYDGLFALLHLTHRTFIPELPTTPTGQVVLTAQYVGDEPWRLAEFADFMGAEGVRAPVGQRQPVGLNFFPHPTTAVQRLPWLYATQSLDGSGPNRRGKYKSAYMNEPFPDRQVEAMWTFLTDGLANSQALLQVDSYGGAVNAVPWNATAIPQRSSIMKLQYQAYWTDPADGDENLAWIRGFYEAMYGAAGPVPDGVMDGCYVNYPDVDLVGWQQLYYQDSYPALQRVKADWDPLNLFNHAQSIELPCA
jgi:FAD/FMN-containing dehydrogenase